MEFSEFKEFIRKNINIIENDNIELENVETEKDDCCGYSEKKKNDYLNEKFEEEKEKLEKYFNNLKENSKKQENKYINDYLIKLSTSFGNYNKEEKNNINSIKCKLNNIINDLFSSINDYQLYVEKSIEKSERMFRNEIKKEKDEQISKNEIKKIEVDSNEGFGFKKIDIFIYPGNNINLKGISIKIYKEFYPKLSTPFISIVFPPKNINLFEKITSYLREFEKTRDEQIFIISKEKSIERITMKINFIKNFKYFNWIEMFSDVLNKFSLFKFEFLTPIMLNQPLDSKVLYDILKSFLLIQIQGDIPIKKLFEFLRVEKVITQIITQIIPDSMRILLKALTSITFTLNTSIDEIPFKNFKSKIINQTTQSDYL